MYEIVHYFQDPNLQSVVLDTVDTLGEAQAHCNDPETSSRTCEGANTTALTEMYGPWFDGYREV
jgi:hypothetical protein